MKNLIWIVIAVVIVVGGYMLFSGKSAQQLAEEASQAVDVPALREGAEEVGEAIGDAAETIADAAGDVGDELTGADDSAGETADVTVDASTPVKNFNPESEAALIEPVELKEPVRREAAEPAEENVVPSPVEADQAAKPEAVADDADPMEAEDVPDAQEEAPVNDAAAKLDQQPADAAQTDEATAPQADEAAKVAEETTSATESPTAEAPATTAPAEESSPTAEATSDPAQEQTGDAETTAAVPGTESDAKPVDPLLTIEGFDLDKVNAMIDESNLSKLRKASLKRGLESAQGDEAVMKTLLEQLRDALNR